MDFSLYDAFASVENVNCQKPFESIITHDDGDLITKQNRERVNRMGKSIKLRIVIRLLLFFIFFLIIKIFQTDIVIIENHIIVLVDGARRKYKVKREMEYFTLNWPFLKLSHALSHE